MVTYSQQLPSVNASGRFAEEYLRIKEEAFKEGAAPSSDVVDARLNLAKIRIERLQAAYYYDMMARTPARSLRPKRAFPRLRQAGRSHADPLRTRFLNPILNEKHNIRSYEKSNVIGLTVGTSLRSVAVSLIQLVRIRPVPTLIQGEVEATDIKISSKLAGRIEQMDVQEGERVKKGQLLFVLSTPEAEAKLQQAEAARMAASAQARRPVRERACRRSKAR